MNHDCVKFCHIPTWDTFWWQKEMWDSCKRGEGWRKQLAGSLIILAAPPAGRQRGGEHYGALWIIMEESTIQSAPLFQLKEDQPLITIRLHADKESLFNWHKKHTFRRRKNTRFTSSCMMNVAQYQFSGSGYIWDSSDQHLMCSAALNIHPVHGEPETLLSIAISLQLEIFPSFPANRERSHCRWEKCSNLVMEGLRRHGGVASEATALLTRLRPAVAVGGDSRSCRWSSELQNLPLWSQNKPLPHCFYIAAELWPFILHNSIDHQLKCTCTMEKEGESLLVFPLKGWESPPAAPSPPPLPPSPTPHPVKQVHSAAASCK